MAGNNDTGFDFCTERFQGQFSRGTGRHSSYTLFLERAAVRARVGAVSWGVVAGGVLLLGIGIRIRIGFQSHRRGIAGERHDNLGEKPPLGVGKKVLPARHRGVSCRFGSLVRRNWQRNVDRIAWSRSVLRKGVYRGASDLSRNGMVAVVAVVVAMVARAVVAQAGFESGSQMGEWAKETTYTLLAYLQKLDVWPDA